MMTKSIVPLPGTPTLSRNVTATVGSDGVLPPAAVNRQRYWYDVPDTRVVSVNSVGAAGSVKGPATRAHVPEFVTLRSMVTDVAGAPLVAVSYTHLRAHETPE